MKIGDRLRVVAGAMPVAELEVVDVAERWASCRILSSTRPIATGDVVVSAEATPAAKAPAPATVPATPAAPAPTPASLPPSPAPGARAFAVKYRSAGTVYLDAGLTAGLAVGDRLVVSDGKATLGELEVVYAADRSASCKVLSETRPVRAGDKALLLTRPGGAAAPATAPVPAQAAAAEAPAGTPAAAPAATKPAGPRARVRGSASLGYYRSWDDTESGLDFEERTARLDLGVYDIAGQPLSFTLRARSRQDVRSRDLSARTPRDERSDRLYEAALRYEPPSDRFAVEAGRIGIYRFVGIGYLDGLLARYRLRPSLQVGGFAGKVADIEGLSLDSYGQKYGGFVRLAPGGRYSRAGYDATLAFVRENAGGDVSREYLSLESRFGGGGRWSLFERAELDLNTGWRKEATGKGTQLSNVSVSGNLRVASSAWAYVSYDGRRNYRYSRNRLVPEDVFDDLLQQGLRAGVNLARPTGFGASAGFGMSLKEPDPRHPELDIANAYSANAGVRHSSIFGSSLSASLDASGFSNGYTNGGLVTARLGRRFRAGHTLDLSYGRSLYRVKLNEQDRTTQWLRLMGRGELGRRVYLQGDVEYDSGDDLKGPRGFLELGVVF